MMLPITFWSCQNKQNVVKIGVSLPLTGSDNSIWGKNALNGINIAIDEVNQLNTKYKYEFIIEDSKSDKNVAVSNLNKFISLYNIKYCVVDMVSDIVLSMAPIAEKNKVIILSPGASASAITQAGDYVFRNWPSDVFQAETQAKVISEVLGWKRIAILSRSDSYGKGLSEELKKDLNSNVQIVYEQYFNEDINDYKTFLYKIKKVNCDGIYLPVYPQQVSQILVQARQLGLTQNFIGTESFEDYNIIKQARDASEGLLYTFPEEPLSDNKVANTFREKYTKKYGKIGTPADAAYDAVYMLVNSIEKGNNNVEEVKEELHNIKKYQGASGIISMDNNGDAIKPFELKIIKNGKFERYME